MDIKKTLNYVSVIIFCNFIAITYIFMAIKHIKYNLMVMTNDVMDFKISRKKVMVIKYLVSSILIQTYPT